MLKKGILSKFQHGPQAVAQVQATSPSHQPQSQPQTKSRPASCPGPAPDPASKPAPAQVQATTRPRLWLAKLDTSYHQFLPPPVRFHCKTIPLREAPPWILQFRVFWERSKIGRSAGFKPPWILGSKISDMEAQAPLDLKWCILGRCPYCTLQSEYSRLAYWHP